MVRRAVSSGLPLSLMLIAPATAMAAVPSPHVISASIIGSIFGTIGHVIMGAFSWTASLASKFLLTTLAGFVKLLIPQSWLNQGLSVMEWIVAVPDYAGTVSTPGGGHTFGFAGINALRELFMWLGLAVAPLALTYATSKALVDESEPVAAPLARVLGLGVLVASYGYWWRQAAALADQVTHTILTVPDVSQGLYKLMAYAVGGVALGGWQLIDLGLMGAIGIELLGLIFFKVVLILCGALLYATGPLMIGLAATRGGHALARAWASAAAVLFGIGIVWAALFAVGALLINDAGSAGPLIAGNSTFGSLMSGLMLALAGLASLWMCLKVAREAGGLLRMQLAGAFALGRIRGRGSSGGVASTVRTTGRSLSGFGTRLATATSAAGNEMLGSVPAGATVSRTTQSVRQLGRRGLAGTAAAAAGAGARTVAPRVERAIGGSRVGAVAVNAARTGASSWRAGRTLPTATRGTQRSQHTPGSKQEASQRAGQKQHTPAPQAESREIGAKARVHATRRTPKRKLDSAAPSERSRTTAAERVVRRSPSSSTTAPLKAGSRTPAQPDQSGVRSMPQPARSVQRSAQPQATTQQQAAGQQPASRSPKPASAAPLPRASRRRPVATRPWKRKS